jgi:Kef-type K+ transport system membrane component KefB
MSAEDLPRVFLILGVLLACAHFFGCLVRTLMLPQVVGEIIGGLLLGPTVLGLLLPSAYASLSLPWLNALFYWLGLVLLMFVSGLEVQKSLTSGDRLLVGAVLLGSTVIPFAAGWVAMSFVEPSGLIGSANNRLALQVTVATACAVTSIPVLSKMFLDLGIMQTRFATIVLATAMIHDVILYAALSVATGLVRADARSASGVVGNVLTTCLFFAVTLLVVPSALAKVNELRANLVARSSRAGYSLVICFLLAALSGVLHINIVFGAFVAGLVIGTMPAEHFSRARATIKDVSLAFFVPLYFAVVGFKLDLVHHLDVGLFVGFVVLSTTAQLFGTVLAARAAGQGWLPSLNLGVAMNSRGGPGIVLATIAFEEGIINESFFATLVLAAIVTSIVAGYWFRLVLSKGVDLLRDHPRAMRPIMATRRDGDGRSVSAEKV